MAGRDKDATWRSLNDACRVSGWSEGRVEDGIENRLLPFRGYVQGLGSVTGETLKPDWTIAKVYGDDCKLSVFWRDSNGVVIETVEVRLPTNTAAPAPSAPVQRWRKPPAAKDLEIAALAAAKTYQPDDPPTEPEWRQTLIDKLGKPVSRKVARGALARWAPNLRRKQGQKRNRRG